MNSRTAFLVLLKIVFVCHIPLANAAKTPLNILFVTGYFPHLTQRFILDQITELLDRHHTIKIHAFHKNPHQKIQTDVREYNLVKRVTYGEQLPPLAEYDIIFVQFGYHGTQVVQQARKQNYQGKIVVCFRGNDLTGYMQRDPHMYDTLFQEADLFLPVCNYFKKLLIEYGCPAEKIKVHHSPIRTKFFEFKERKIHKHDKIHMMTVARLTEKKGIEYVIQALVILRRKYPHIRYMIIGDGKEKAYLNRLIQEKNLYDIVRLYGWATHEEIKGILNRSHIFILPSVTGKDGDQEGIPNVLKEAMAAGVPVISTYHAGIQELITDGQSGILVHEKDVEGIVNAVSMLIKDSNLYSNINRASRQQVVEEFDVIGVIDRLEDIFYTLIKEKKMKGQHE